jgi:flavodoxin/NAD-dependent dihydropyrimidine dehydrogenase PreA subunit
VKAMKKIKLAYFSGTGGTAKAARFLEENLKKSGCEVNLVPLETAGDGIGSIDMLVLLFPVHAFDAPIPVYHWLKTLPQGNKISAAVISVAAGGDHCINAASRLGSIKILTRKGYDVFYERMLVMPMNIILSCEPSFNRRILELLPQKTESIAADLLSRKNKRILPPLKSRILTLIGKTEKPWAKCFGKELTARKSCSCCGLCQRNCPMGNIQLKNGRPRFGWRCIACFRCVYACPSFSIYPRFSRFMVLKEGYHLEQMEKKLDSLLPEPDEKITTGFYSIFKEYMEIKEL